MVECNVREKDQRYWIYFFRQLLICSGSWNCYFMLGVTYGSPTVLVPQLRKENITVSYEMASWLPASITYGGLPWVFILPILAWYIGRKKSQLFVSLITFVGYLVFYLSNDVIQILISELFQGPLAAAYLTTSVIVVTEYSSSRYRGMFLTVKSASFFWGIVVANAVGTFFYWKYLGVIGITCSVYNLVTVFFWSESPYWLASERKFQECSESHRWLIGTDKESEMQLEKIIKKHQGLNFIKDQNNCKRILQTLVKKDFLKPVSFAALLTCLYCFSGKMFCTVYAVDILKKITKGDTAAYSSMLILDGITVLSMYVGCLISKVMKRRFMLILFSSIAVVFLLLISLFLFLVKNQVLDDNIYLSVAFLTGYSIAIGCGPMILSTSIIGELLPIESKSLAMCVIALVFKAVFGTFLKISPYCFKYMEMHGTFLMYALLSIVCLVLIYIYVPETKDKTLQQIDDEVKNRNDKKGDEITELMPMRS